jgi:hypothetical protein
MNSNTIDFWPDDDDGQVLRRLRNDGFDFTKKYVVDFVIDFETWPPDAQVLERIAEEFPNTTEYTDEVTGESTLIVKVEDFLTYRFVVEAQARLTALASVSGGTCESWGVLH